MEMSKQKDTSDGVLLVDRGSLWLSPRLLTRHPRWLRSLLARRTARTRSSWHNFEVAPTFQPRALPQFFNCNRGAVDTLAASARLYCSLRGGRPLASVFIGSAAAFRFLASASVGAPHP